MLKISPICLACFVIVSIFKQGAAESAPGPCALLDTGGSSICINLDEINLAFRQARLSHKLLEPLHFTSHKAHQHHHEIDHLGSVLIETARIIAKTYKLDHEQIFEILPTLDVELTDIWKFCPVIFKPKKCKVSKYRTLSGHCNNLNYPDWGAALAPFKYILPPERHDGLSEPREYGKDLHPLPSARVVSSQIHNDRVTHDHAVTVMLIAWGQIIDHDITFTAETKDNAAGKDPECCNTENIYQNIPIVKHHNCYPIKVPHDDPFYSYHNHHCMNFARSFAGVRTGCRLGPRNAFNTISSFLDANFVYGSNIELGKKLRSGKHGTLLTLPLFKNEGLKDLLPLKINEPDDGCIRPNSDIFCFLAGDNRVNEQLVLTTLHTIFMREHNQIALALAEMNKHWDDEKLYQETRRIIIAITQHITFNEFLPMILGKKLIHDYGLSVEEGYWTGYDPYANPGALEEFITSAFRFGHSLLPHRIERWSTSHHQIDSTKLHEMLRQPFNMFRPGYADTFIMGLVNQFAQVMDEGVTDQVTTLLFKEKGKNFGMDLAAMNIQRGRDHGVQPYAAYRKICGLSPIHDWDDLIGVMRNETVYKYRQIYRSPWDIDLWSGGVSELPKDGALLGPTFGCLIAKQFHGLRYGDRFWYELPDLPSSFTLEQVNEIKRMKLSRLLCDNGDDIRSIQLFAMVHPDHEINPRVSCHSQILPRLDLEKWRDSETKVEDSVKDTKGDSSVLQKAHLYTDLETIKPPLYDSRFEKQKSRDGKSYDKSPESPKVTTSHSQKHDPNLIAKFIPPFKKLPTTDIEGHKPPTSKPDINGYVDNFYDAVPPEYIVSPFPPGQPPRIKPSILSIVKNRNNLLTKIFRRRRKNRHFRHPPNIRPFPPSPFPGFGGVFSPNPGYLVRQKFWLPG